MAIHAEFEINVNPSPPGYAKRYLAKIDADKDGDAMANRRLPDVDAALLFIENVPSEYFDDFRKLADDDGLDIWKSLARTSPILRSNGLSLRPLPSTSA